MDETIDWDGTYSAAMDSVDLLNAGQPTSETDEDWAATVERNVEHLRIQLAKKWPKTYDLEPFAAAVGDG